MLILHPGLSGPRLPSPRSGSSRVQDLLFSTQGETRVHGCRCGSTKSTGAAERKKHGRQPRNPVPGAPQSHAAAHLPAWDSLPEPGPLHSSACPVTTHTDPYSQQWPGNYTLVSWLRNLPDTRAAIQGHSEGWGRLGHFHISRLSVKCKWKECENSVLRTMAYEPKKPPN